MKLPPVEAKIIIKILQNMGYQKMGQSGSHIQFKNERGQ